MNRIAVRLQSGRDPQSGLILIGVLVLLALASMTALNAGQRWADTRQRDAEAELLFIGEQYRAAIESYWREAPNTVHQMPTRLEDLVSDNRFPFPKRHLRKLYRDPLNPENALVEVRDGPFLIGVRSDDNRTPFRQAGFDGPNRSFNGATSYAAWTFSYVPPATVQRRDKASPVPIVSGGPLHPIKRNP